MIRKVLEFFFGSCLVKIFPILTWMTLGVASPLSLGAAGVLSGSFSTLPAGANVNLTPEGSLDWAHWGLTATDDFKHKASISSKITNFTVIGDALIQQFNDNATGYTWTDGDPEP